MRCGVKGNGCSYPTPPKRCAGCARDITYVGRWKLPCAPQETRVQSVTPAIRANVAPAIPQPRRTEDGAPYELAAKRTLRHGT